MQPAAVDGCHDDLDPAAVGNGANNSAPDYFGHAAACSQQQQDGGSTPSASAMSGPSSSQGGTKTKQRSGPKSKHSPFIGVSQYRRTGRWEVRCSGSVCSRCAIIACRDSKNSCCLFVHLLAEQNRQ